MKFQLGIIGLAIIVVSAVSAAWWWNRPDRYPVPVGLSSGSVQAIRAPAPKEPSIPDLPPDLAIRVPGFESSENCFSPSLTADLKQIVYATPGSAATGFDLHLAVRNSVADSFGTPRRLMSTVTPETEAYPALSPNGLKLLFVRSDAQPEIWFCQRPDFKTEFSEAEPWTVARVGDTTSTVGTPQFVTDRLAVFSRIDTAGVRTLWGAQQAADGTFSEPFLYAAPEGSPTVFFNPDGLRGYFGGTEGQFFFFWRRHLKGEFSPQETLLPPSSTGPFDGTLWVSPNEDVVFYCTSGPGQPIGARRQLWMIGF
ncbi:MAG: hypothetical protein R3C59_05115 [Planctomycetaceae bacterium]